ncbi:MAG: hypothetical protein K2M95_03505 [Clostridiales bacterium]|nr:hypothetical protein [Clostridiales bacterium]
MNAKQFKYMQIFEQYVQDGLLDEKAAKKHFASLLQLDYPLALDTWDYVCSAYEQELADSEDAGRLLGDTVFALFYEKNAQRTVKALLELPQVRKAVFSYSPAADKGTTFSLLVDALVANKTETAEEYLKCLVKNERIEYGPFMKEVLERLFIEILKKNPSKRVEMSRKLSALMMTYIGKIKTDERAMLLQRVKETM